MLVTIKLLMFIEALLIAGMLLFRFCQRRETRPVIKPLYIGAVLVTPAVGLFAGLYHFFYLFMLLLPFAAGRNRRTLLGLYLAVALQFPDLSQAYVLGPLYIGSVSALSIFNLGALIALMMVRGRERRTIGAINVCAWTMYVLMLISQARGYQLTVVWRLLDFWFLTFVPPYLLITRCVRTREDVSEAMMIFVWSAIICATLAIFESVRGWPLYQAIGYALHMPVIGQGLSATLSIRSGFLRAQGTVANPTTLGIFMAIGLMFAIGLKRYFIRSYFWMINAALVMGLIISQSRGAWIAAGVGYGLMLLYQRRYGLLGALAPIGLIAWAVSGSLSAEGQLGQLLGKSGQGEFTANYRSNLLDRGLEEISKHPTGQTPADLQISMHDLRQGEGIIDFVNTHLYVGLVAGVAGVALWFVVWLYPVIAAYRAKSSRNGRRFKVPIEAPAAALVVCFVALSFTSMIAQNPTMVAISLGMIEATVRTTRRGAAAARPERKVKKAEEPAAEPQLVPA